MCLIFFFFFTYTQTLLINYSLCGEKKNPKTFMDVFPFYPLVGSRDHAAGSTGWKIKHHFRVSLSKVCLFQHTDSYTSFDIHFSFFECTISVLRVAQCLVEVAVCCCFM